jgi:hypothetical protein
MRTLAPAKNAPEHDFVMTPPALAQKIVDYYSPTGRLCDPCRGAGAFYTALQQRSREPVAWCEINESRDFFNHTGQYDWVITNPPWSKFRAFLGHAMAQSNNVVFLATMVHFVTRARLADIYSADFGLKTALLCPQPPAPWPSSGFQLVAMQVTRGFSGPLNIDRALLSEAPQ